jgi:Sugar (and other) transporter
MGWVGACIGMFLMFKVLGRRSMMIGGAFLCGLFMLALAITWTIAPSGIPGGKALTAFAMLYQVAYNGGIGSVSYAVATEAVSSRLRAYSMGSATGLNYVFNWLITFTAPYFINQTSSTYIGVKYCYIWAGSNFITMGIIPLRLELTD